MSEILKDSVLLFRQYAAGNNIEIMEAIDDGIFVKADPLSINRIINNLVENAIKFSNDAGIIKIELKLKDDTIQFSVKDFGSGVPVEMQAKVFEPYYQLTNNKSNIQGMGLGLPIVKKVIEDLNGDIQIISNPKMIPGTEILIALKPYMEPTNEAIISKPAIKASIVNKEVLQTEMPVYDLEKQTILVVEDNITMLNYLFKKLSNKYNVHASINGNEAIKKMKELSVMPDLIITDIMMDKVDGYDFAKIISKSSSYSHIPFIFLSAKSGLADKLQGLQLGAIDYVPKPFSIAELLVKVDSILLYNCQGGFKKAIEAI